MQKFFEENKKTILTIAGIGAAASIIGAYFFPEMFFSNVI